MGANQSQPWPLPAGLVEKDLVKHRMTGFLKENKTQFCGIFLCGLRREESTDLESAVLQRVGNSLSSQPASASVLSPSPLLPFSASFNETTWLA